VTLMIADRARCPVWALDDAPAWWVDRIALAMAAENAAERERQVRDERRRRMAGGGRPR
jgi:hypothetical protein